MTSLKPVTVIIACLMIVAPAFAADKDARLIDSISGQYREYDQMEAVGIIFQGEQVVSPGSEWSIIGAAGWSRISSDYVAADVDLWLLELGVKKDLGNMTAISLYGSGEWVDSGEDFMAGGMHLKFTYRFRPPEADVSPYTSLSLGYAAGKSTPWDRPSDDFSAGIATLCAGCDIAVTALADMNFEVRMHQAGGFSGGPYAHYADGWSAILGLKYYWFK